MYEGPQVDELEEMVSYTDPDVMTMAETLAATFPNLGYAINNAMQNQRRMDAHRYNLELGGIQFGAWDVISSPNPMTTTFMDTDDGGPWEPDIGWGAR